MSQLRQVSTKLRKPSMQTDSFLRSWSAFIHWITVREIELEEKRWRAIWTGTVRCFIRPTFCYCSPGLHRVQSHSNDIYLPIDPPVLKIFETALRGAVAIAGNPNWLRLFERVFRGSLTSLMAPPIRPWKVKLPSLESRPIRYEMSSTAYLRPTEIEPRSTVQQTVNIRLVGRLTISYDRELSHGELSRCAMINPTYSGDEDQSSANWSSGWHLPEPRQSSRQTRLAGAARLRFWTFSWLVEDVMVLWQVEVL